VKASHQKYVADLKLAEATMKTLAEQVEKMDIKPVYKAYILDPLKTIQVDIKTFELLYLGTLQTLSNLTIAKEARTSIQKMEELLKASDEDLGRVNSKLTNLQNDLQGIQNAESRSLTMLNNLATRLSELNTHINTEAKIKVLFATYILPKIEQEVALIRQDFNTGLQYRNTKDFVGAYLMAIKLINSMDNIEKKYNDQLMAYERWYDHYNELSGEIKTAQADIGKVSNTADLNKLNQQLAEADRQAQQSFQAFTRGDLTAAESQLVMTATTIGLAAPLMQRYSPSLSRHIASSTSTSSSSGSGYKSSSSGSGSSSYRSSSSGSSGYSSSSKSSSGSSGYSSSSKTSDSKSWSSGSSSKSSSSSSSSRSDSKSWSSGSSSKSSSSSSSSRSSSSSSRSSSSSSSRRK
jgi:predicted  nucleic acid-binding Zn-ribbon protein